MSVVILQLIFLIIFLLGGFSRRFGGHPDHCHRSDVDGTPVSARQSGA